MKKGSIDENVLSWLTNVPASDVNFRGRLKSANIKTLEEALEDYRISKQARSLIESQLKRSLKK